MKLRKSSQTTTTTWVPKVFQQTASPELADFVAEVVDGLKKR
jgi:hypothetical protein